MSAVTVEVLESTVWWRVPVLDRVRGLAIALMMLDHVSLLLDAGLHTDVLQVVRLTLGRVAMPLFFVLAGYLCTGSAPGRP